MYLTEYDSSVNRGLMLSRVFLSHLLLLTQKSEVGREGNSGCFSCLRSWMVLFAKRWWLYLEGISGCSMLPALCTVRAGYICCINGKQGWGVARWVDVLRWKSFWDYRPLRAVLLLDAGSLHLAFKSMSKHLYLWWLLAVVCLVMN